ncbi:B12-binding domain-containing radical SAM protein [candidate division WOR-3 bacterium]|nr:B12-binding domain-containing radical SAM protein [candidate division WOR-3 bacterium]
MKIILIMPGMGKKKNTSYVRTWQMEPLIIAQLASLTPDDVEIAFYDDRLEQIPYDEDCDLVGITVETYTARRAYYISSQFRKRGIPVVVGGYHPTLLPEEAGEYADAVVIGEAENVWNQILEDTKSKKLKKYYKEPLTSFAGFFPDRSVFAGKNYVKLNLIESARGCPFSCEFCSISEFYSSTYKTRPIEDITKEIQNIKGKRFFFIDDNLVADTKRAKQLFKAITPLKIKWVGQASLQIALDEKLLTIMKKSGCVGVLIGFESINKQNLEKMNKSWNQNIGKYEDLIKKIYKHGIGIYATFLVGYENDTTETIERTFKFAEKSKFLLAAFNHLLPFPGTSAYKRLEEEGRLLKKKWWLSDNYRYGDYAFKPYHHEPEELAKICEQSRKRFYSLPSILKRASNFRGNLQSPVIALIYLIQNLLAEKEVNKKMRIPLGEGLDDYENAK